MGEDGFWKHFMSIDLSEEKNVISIQYVKERIFENSEITDDTSIKPEKAKLLNYSKVNCIVSGGGSECTTQILENQIKIIFVGLQKLVKSIDQVKDIKEVVNNLFLLRDYINVIFV